MHMEKIHKLCSRSQKQTQSSSPPRNPLPLIIFTTASTKKQGLLPHLFILVSLLTLIFTNRLEWKQCFARGPTNFHSTFPLRTSLLPCE